MLNFTRHGEKQGFGTHVVQLPFLELYVMREIAGSGT